MSKVVTTVGAATPDPSSEHADFVENVLPAVKGHAVNTFRYWRRGDREEAVQAAVALAFQQYQKLLAQGKDVKVRAGALATYACRQVKDGRGVGARRNTTDVLAPAARRKQEFAVYSLDDTRDLPPEFAEQLGEHDRSSVADQVAFRVDFAEWLAGLSERWRQIVTACGLGYSGKSVAERFGVTPARICQLRRELAESWDRFQGEEAAVSV